MYICDINKNMSMIFEKREYTDGGPNDKGTTIGFIQAKNKEEANKILNINHGFIQLYEMDIETFLKRKKEAWDEYKMYDL